MFTLSKAAGSRVPDEIKISMAYGIVDIGQAVELDGTVAVAGSPVAAVCTSQYDSTGGNSSATFSPAFPKGATAGKVDALCIPVTGTLLFDADITEHASTAVGSKVNIATGGLGLVYNAAGTDFRVLEILETGTTGASKVRGVFLQPGYFAA
jgi:hypothetical protein